MLIELKFVVMINYCICRVEIGLEGVFYIVVISLFIFRKNLIGRSRIFIMVSESLVVVLVDFFFFVVFFIKVLILLV